MNETPYQQMMSSIRYLKNRAAVIEAILEGVEDVRAQQNTAFSIARRIERKCNLFRPDTQDIQSFLTQFE